MLIDTEKAESDCTSVNKAVSTNPITSFWNHLLRCQQWTPEVWDYTYAERDSHNPYEWSSSD
jgi:hypothetical protein